MEFDQKVRAAMFALAVASAALAALGLHFHVDFGSHLRALEGGGIAD